MGCVADQRRLQPVALTIAGSDSGGNAGVQADLRVFHGFGVHGCTAITALTAQNPSGVAGLLPATPAFLRLQLKSVFDAYQVRAIKTGMLHDARLIHTVAAFLQLHPGIPLVIDPVMVSTSGTRLLQAAAVNTLLRRLLPLATLITPNLPETEVLLGRTVVDRADAACVLAARFHCAVLVKGGHDAAQQSCDLLCVGQKLYRVRSPVVRHPLSLHGTGCTLSAAITAALASGRSLTEAVVEGKAYVYEAIRTGRCVGPHANVLGMAKCKGTSRVKIEAWAR